MELTAALEFAADHNETLLTTLRRDGRPQQSVVNYVLEGNTFTISITDTRAKTRNLRRDPRAALWVAGSGPYEWVSFDGTVSLSPVATSPDDATCDALVDYYRRAVGEHENWEEYREAMVADGRLLARFTATSATGMLS